jgi:hypothetical protein
MKGYFSELARHTGLRIGGGSPAATALSSPTSAHQNIRGEVKGLEVEEVAFTSSPPPPTADRAAVAEPTPETISTDAVRSIPDRKDAPTKRDSDLESDFNGTQVFPEAKVEAAFEVTTTGNPPASKSGTKEGSVRPAEMETAIIGHPRVVISEKTSTGAETPDANQIPESVSGLEERNAFSEVERYDSADRNQERRGVPAEPDLGPFARAAEQSDAGLDERIERQTIVRNYLQEISEWISTPTSSEEEPDSFISADSVATAEDQARRPARANATEPGRLPADALEQQDLSLSIGTIKIVVEEPRNVAPVPPALPAKPEAAFERTKTVSTDLSRYYLNRW